MDEKWCKIPVVQGQVAMLKGWQNTLNGIGSEFSYLLLGAVDCMDGLE